MKLTNRSLLLLFIWLVFAIVESVFRLNHYQTEIEFKSYWIVEIWSVIGAGIVILFFWEILSLRYLKKIQIKRTIAQTLPVGHYCEVKLTIKNHLSRKLISEVIDHVPDFCQTKNFSTKISLLTKQKVDVKYEIKAVERGDLNLSTCELWVNSELNFLKKRYLISCTSVSKIYPNYRSILRYSLLATEQKSRQIGIRQQQQRGDGLEFHQLREYRMGDTLSQVDWRATSRLQKMISKDYQQERNQNIIFLLDSGRRMRTKDGEVSHFDQALNAMLLVSSIALSQGDAVGLKTFGGKELFVTPKKGASSIHSMLNHVYDLHPTNNASDLVSAVENLNKKFKKRSLIILVSNIRVEDEVELKTAVTLLKKHHLVMLANLKEQILQDVLSKTVDQINDAIKFSQTISYLQQRNKLHQRLAHDGVITVDSLPKQLAVNMANQYFLIKKSGRL